MDVTNTSSDAMYLTDGYKLDHRRQFPDGTEYVLANWTARGSRIEGVDSVVFFGLQHWLTDTLGRVWGEFFAGDIDAMCAEYEEFLLGYAGPNDIGSDHFRALHKLGYLPLEFKALPEGTNVPLRVPMFTIENTHPDFFWLVNYIETSVSNGLWMPCTSATTSRRMRMMMNEFAIKTGSTAEDMPFYGHDFSIRGMAGVDSAVISGMGHLVSFTGSDNLPAIRAVSNYYPTDSFVGGGVPATEHSVMCAGGQDDELLTYKRLLGLYPVGLLSVVSDTWDLWNVIENILPQLKSEIMGRDGKLVIRPDSGDPADILCGIKATVSGTSISDKRAAGTNLQPEEKGVVELLWEQFGGTVNEAGYKVLDPHVGVIYGDAINYDRAVDIYTRLEAKGFAAVNVVFGMGSYGFQYQTRDTFGFAIKSTNVVINGVDTPIFKDPKTDNGLKKSLKGRIAVVRGIGGESLVAIDQIQSSNPILSSNANLLKTVWKDGEFVKRLSFDQVRENASV